MFKVCVRSYTYNHSQYIGDALNGFVKQKTDFPFVVSIIDDASTDNTRQIITSFVNDFFNTDDDAVSSREEKDFGTVLFAQHRENLNCFISVTLLKENHYSQKKSKLPYLSRWIDEVPYVALCEGDDYWTDPRKLQKQVDYLEAHPDCMLCVHAADWKTGESIYSHGCQETVPKDYTVNELILCGGLYFATASFVCRTELSRDWPEWRRKAGVGDFPLQILAGLHGKVHYLPDKMCVYRYRSEGSWSSSILKKDVHSAFHKNKIEWMKMLDEATGHKYQKAIYDQLYWPYYSLYSLHEIGFLEYARAILKSSRRGKGKVMKDFLRFNLRPIYELRKYLRRDK